MLLFLKFYKRNGHYQLFGMAHDAHCWNSRTAAASFAPRISAPMAQTVRQGSMRAILDLLETWLIATARALQKS